jgi:hypothetical protein
MSAGPARPMRAPPIRLGGPRWPATSLRSVNKRPVDQTVNECFQRLRVQAQGHISRATHFHTHPHPAPDLRGVAVE